MRLSTIGAAMLWALLAAVSPAGATIDMNGNFHVDVTTIFFSTPLGCSVNFVQAGTALSASGSCDFVGAISLPTGSIDSASGAFTLAGSASVFCPTLSIAGTTAANSQTFTGSLTCSGGPLPLGGTLFGSRCGNGAVDPGEQCDDGNRVNGDCCSSTCQYEAPGSFCSPDPNPCTTDACNGAGVCLHTNNTDACDDGSSCTTGDVCGGGSCHGAFVASGTACDDDDPCTVGDQCDAGGVCTPGTGELDCGACMVCVAGFGCSTGGEGSIPVCKKTSVPLSALLTITDRPVDTKDKAAWTWSKGGATTPSEFGDPRMTTSYKLCIYDRLFGDTFDHAILGADIPAGGTCDGKPCWQATNSGYKYKNKSASADGIQSIVLKAGARGKAKITVRAKGAALETPTLPIDFGVTPLLVQLQAANGQCWEAQYLSALKDTPITLKARGGSPSGAFVE